MKKAAARQGKPLPFHKLHGAGNDIIVVHAKDFPKTTRTTAAKADLIKHLAHRQLGVGCDQVVEVLSRKPLAIQIWNGDGSKAEMCANGARAFLFLAARKGWIAKKSAKVPLKISGKKYHGLATKEGYEVGLGKPEILGRHELFLGASTLPLTKVSVGNPHAVIFLGVGEGEWDAPKDFDFRRTGAAVETHPDFPNKTNVEFIRSWAVDGSVVKAVVEVWERGAGATLSCGSGAVAVAAVLKQKSGASQFEIRMTSFTLRVRFGAEGAFLSGPVAPVAEGVFFS